MGAEKVSQHSSAALATKFMGESRNWTTAVMALLLLHKLGYGALTDDVEYTERERDALDELSRQVSPFMESNFTKSDIYLIHWLRQNDLNVDVTRGALLATLKWRNESRVADDMLEDWSSFEGQFPANINGRDREGRPILLVVGSAWNPRKAALAGRMEAFKRFMVRTVVELPFQTLERMYDEEGSGRNISQYIFLLDLQGVNVREQICIQCITAWVNLMAKGEEHYPRLAFRTIFINAPRVFDLVQNAVRPLMIDYTKEHSHIFDHDRSKWQPFLHQYINPDQLPPRFGGTKLKSSKLTSTVLSQTIDEKLVPESNATIVAE